MLQHNVSQYTPKTLHKNPLQRQGCPSLALQTLKAVDQSSEQQKNTWYSSLVFCSVLYPFFSITTQDKKRNTDPVYDHDL